MSNESHHYYVIIGDHKSQKVLLSREQAFDIINNYSRDLYEARLIGEDDLPKNQRKMATLLSVAFYCGGGWEPFTRTKAKKSKTKFPHFSLDEYVFNYTRNFLTQFRTYDPNKGYFGKYLNFVKQHAVRDTFAYLRRKDHEKELMATIENAMSIRFGTKSVQGNTVFRDEHSDGQSFGYEEDFYSLDEEVDDIGSEIEESEDCMGGCVEADDS